MPKQLADYVTGYLTYRDPDERQLQANFAALPHNSRLGGDNTYDNNGNYRTGDGWALGTMNVKPVERDGLTVLALTSPPIAGFVSSIKPNADNTAYVPVPAPRFDPRSHDFVEGHDVLIDENRIAIPAESTDGTVARSNIDSASLSKDHKSKHIVAETPLDDPRRRLFEEKGMTCIQCHVRNFDEGDYLYAVSKPGEDVQPAWTRPIPRVFFVITPTDHDGRSEYIRREEAEQVGSVQGAIRDYLGIETRIGSELAKDWPFKTTKGRN